MPIYENTELTPKEHLLLEAERDEARLSREHQLAIKRLDIEVKKLEAKWSAWIKLPSLIIKLPLFIILGIGYIFAIMFKQSPPKEFWNLLKW